MVGICREKDAYYTYKAAVVINFKDEDYRRKETIKADPIDSAIHSSHYMACYIADGYY